MSRRPKFAKPDANQSELVQECRKAGMIVWITAPLGGKVLDLVIWWRGLGLPFEIKQEGKEDDLTAKEEDGIWELAGVGVTARVVTCFEDVKDAFEKELRCQR